MIVELTVQAEYNENGIVRVGIAPTTQSPWVIVMLLETVIRHVERELLVQRIEDQRLTRGISMAGIRPPRG